MLSGVYTLLQVKLWKQINSKLHYMLILIAFTYIKRTAVIAIIWQVATIVYFFFLKLKFISQLSTFYWSNVMYNISLYLCLNDKYIMLSLSSRYSLSISSWNLKVYVRWRVLSFAKLNVSEYDVDCLVVPFAYDTQMCSIPFNTHISVLV